MCSGHCHGVLLSPVKDIMISDFVKFVLIENTTVNIIFKGTI